LTRLIKRSIHTAGNESNSEIHKESKRRHKILRGTQFEKKSRTGIGEFTIFKGLIVNSTEIELYL